MEKAHEIYRKHLGRGKVNLVAAYQDGMIAKKDLVDGAWYKGHCRNAEFAKWQAAGHCFVYEREKFSMKYTETIQHPEDDDGFDIFVPIELVARPAFLVTNI